MASVMPHTLWLDRLSMMTMSPGFSDGTNNCVTYTRKISPLRAPSNTKGTVVPSSFTEDKMVVRWNRVSGTASITRSCLRALPYRRVIPVFTPLSSRNTNRLASSMVCLYFHAFLLQATSGRCCSAACAVFFTPQAQLDIDGFA